MLCHYRSSVVNSLYMKQKLRGLLTFSESKKFCFSQRKTGESPKADIKSKRKSVLLKIKHLILQQVWQNWDFIYLFFKQKKNLDSLSLAVWKQSKEGCQQGIMNVGIKGSSHPSVLGLHIMEYQLRVSFTLPVESWQQPPSVSCSCQTLACSSPWRDEGEGQLSRKEAPWWAWNEGREVCTETGPRGTLINFVYSTDSLSWC